MSNSNQGANGWNSSATRTDAPPQPDSNARQSLMPVSSEQVSEMLKKQKRVEGIVHNQSMPRQAIVETLVQRQHLAELQNLLLQLSAADIGNILDALPVGDAGALAGLPAEAPFDTPPERVGDFDLDRFYPRLAKQRGITGSTRLRLHISDAGRVVAVEVQSSDPPGVFEQAAERLARSLHFRPAIRAGQAVAAQQDTIIAWTLK